MKYVPFFPLFRFILIIIKYGGLSPKGVFHLMPWLIKLTLLEPFRWMEVLICERKILQTQVEYPPVFILGHYRSGTTFLQRIFACDTRFGTMTAFEHALPDLMLLFEKSLSPFLQRISDLFKAQNHFHRIPFSWSQPGEEDLALVAMTSLHAASWGFLFPRKFKNIFEAYFVQKAPHVIRDWKQDYMYLVKKLILKNKGKPLILKSPPNTARAKELLELFPDARFIYISREPSEVFVSTKRLWQVVMNLHVLGPARHVDFDELVSFSMELFHRNWSADKKLISPQQYMEVQYHELIKNPAKVVRDIYSKLQLPEFSRCEPQVSEFLESQKSYKTLRHVIPEETLDKIKNHTKHQSGINLP